MEQPANQPAPQVVDLQVQTPVVMSEQAMSHGTQPPKKNSKLLFILLAVVVIVGVAIASYFLIWNAPQATLPVEEMTTQVPLNSTMPKATAPAELEEGSPVSATDSVDAIEQDLENTTVSDDSSFYTDIETDLNNL